MRTSRLPLIGAILGIAASAFVASVPASADPAYRSDAVIEMFVKDKAAKSGFRTRGICFDDGSKSCGAPAPAPAVFDLLVTFDFDSDRLTKAARENLDEFGKALLDPRLKGSQFDVDGHTDAKGGDAYNLQLSERRARAVVDYLASLGVDKAALSARGFGKTKPRVADPFSPENRRVEAHLAE